MRQARPGSVGPAPWRTSSHDRRCQHPIDTRYGCCDQRSTPAHRASFEMRYQQPELPNRSRLAHPVRRCAETCRPLRLLPAANDDNAAKQGNELAPPHGLPPYREPPGALRYTTSCSENCAARHAQWAFLKSRSGHSRLRRSRPRLAHVRFNSDSDRQPSKRQFGAKGRSPTSILVCTSICRVGGHYVVSRQRTPDTLERKFANGLDCDSILDCHQPACPDGSRGYCHSRARWRIYAQGYPASSGGLQRSGHQPCKLKCRRGSMSAIGP